MSDRARLPIEPVTARDGGAQRMFRSVQGTIAEAPEVRADLALRDRLDAILVRRGAEIDALLEDYGLPFVRRERRAGDARPLDRQSP